MADLPSNKNEKLFVRDAEIGLIGRGETIEACFCNMARSMFSIMADTDKVHQIQVITFEFEEANTEMALATWLNLLLVKAREHHLILGDFRLKHEENTWKATVAGEPWREHDERGLEVKEVKLSLLSIYKTDHTWEARCVVDI